MSHRPPTIEAGRSPLDRQPHGLARDALDLGHFRDRQTITQCHTPSLDTYLAFVKQVYTALTANLCELISLLGNQQALTRVRMMSRGATIVEGRC